MPSLEYLLAYVYFVLLSWFIGFLLVPVFKSVAYRFDILDQPGTRKVHAIPKPLLGGCAVYFTFIFVVVVHTFFIQFLEYHTDFEHAFPNLVALSHGVRFVTDEMTLLLSGATLVFLVGLLDDIYGVKFPPLLKFLAQFLAASFLVMKGIHITFLPYGWMDRVVTIIWIVGITNSFNLLDNMDGLASGVALISSGIFIFIAISQDQYFIAFLLLVLAGSILGFFRYNFYPSRIFLGDSGSLFIGYMLGSLTVMESFATRESPTLFPVLIPVLILVLPLFDTFSVIYIRLREKRPIYLGDKSHLSHRLVALGLSVKEAVQFLYLITFCLGLSAILLLEVSAFGSIVIIIHTLAIVSMISLFMVIQKNRNNKKKD
jgi:UDP-GlcNAc:undecaprenyl-phosphate GlcNAc-1-phosphate transferase